MPLSCQGYYSLRLRLRSCLQASKPQLDNLCLLTFGLFVAGHCQLPKIATRLPFVANAASGTQRLWRLLKNSAVQPMTLYQPVTRFLLAGFTNGSVRLIMDATDLGGRLPVLFVAVAYKGRALPLAWRMLPQPGCSAFSEQKALLSLVAERLPAGTQVTLLADREYSSVAVIRFCCQHGWHFCLRAKKNRWFLDREGNRRKIRSVPLAPGQRLYLADIKLPALSQTALSLCCGWSSDHKDDQPWYILSDLPADGRVLSLYALRFHIEEMFRDFKEAGFRLETTRLREAERVSRLLLGICLCYVWLMNAGVWVSKRGWRRQVDRHAKRQLSYFQIGWRFLWQAWIKGQPIPCQLHAYA